MAEPHEIAVNIAATIGRKGPSIPTEILKYIAVQNEQVAANVNNTMRKRQQESRNHAVAATALKNRKKWGDIYFLFHSENFETMFF